MVKKKMSDLDVQDRPREKMKRFGPEQLQDQELVQILLGSGGKDNDVRKLASRIVSLAKKKPEVTREDLQEIKGLGDAKISVILSALELGKRKNLGQGDITSVKPEEVWEAVSDIHRERREYFTIIFLNSRDCEIARQNVSVGTLNASLVHPREVFNSAIEVGAAAIIGVHNHPSGDVDPSDADLHISKRLVEAGQILGIEFYDHIIVVDPKRNKSGQKYYSIRENHEDIFD